MDSLHKSIVRDLTYRIIVDDVSEGKGKEYRATIYDTELLILSEGWGDTPLNATLEAMTGEVI
jgi:hypothetical protein